jgi:hypothetical protein
MSNTLENSAEYKDVSVLRLCRKTLQDFDKLLPELQELDDILKRCHKMFRNGEMKWKTPLLRCKEK